MWPNYQVGSLKNKRVLVTGASSGIGFATSCVLASQGAHVIAVARREDKLKELSGSIHQHVSGAQFDLVAGDITKESFVNKLIEGGFFDVDVLINNAGLAIGKDNVEDNAIADWDLMIETNISAAFRMIKEVLPSMKKRGEGDIINIASIAGYESYAQGAVYCATKHALLAFARSLRKETFGQNIRVMNLSPGMVETEFSLVRFQGDENKAKSVYQGMTPLTPFDIARHIEYMLTRPRHICIDEMICLATDQGSATQVARKG